jgi:methylglyoxal synthase
MSHDGKKEMMVQFCIAYKAILAKHEICATSITGKLVAEATGLPVKRYLAGSQGDQQIGARMPYDRIDMVRFVTDGYARPRCMRTDD